MSEMNPYSSPEAPGHSNFTSKASAPTPGMLITICVFYILFGIANLTIMPCSYGFALYAPEFLETAAEADPNITDDMIETLKKNRDDTMMFIVAMLIIGLIFGAIQLVVAIAGFKKSDLARMGIPFVAVVGILLIVGSFVFSLVTNSQELEGFNEQAQTQATISFVASIVLNILFVLFYVFAIVYSQGEKYKNVFAPPRSY